MFILWSLRVICGVKWQIEGIENLPNGPFILVSNHQSAWESFYLQTLLSSGSRKLKNGFSIIIFPEGTRAKPHEGLRKFSNSCGSLSVNNNVPIIPICHNSGLYWQNKRFIKYPGTVIVRIGNEMYGKDPKELTNRAYSWIKENFNKIH